MPNEYLISLLIKCNYTNLPGNYTQTQNWNRVIQRKDRRVNPACICADSAAHKHEESGESNHLKVKQNTREPDCIILLYIFSYLLVLYCSVFFSLAEIN